MTIGVNIKMVLAGGLAAVAVGAPIAQACVPVKATTVTAICNEAGRAFAGGQYDATDGDPAIPARFQAALKALPGHGAGLIKAAANSPALSACGLSSTPPPVTTPPPTNNGGGNGTPGGPTGPGGPAT